MMVKTKLISFVMVLSGLFFTGSAFACSVCYGAAPNTTALATALKISVLSLLTILTGVLGSIVWFFIQTARRSKNICLTK